MVRPGSAKPLLAGSNPVRAFFTLNEYSEKSHEGDVAELVDALDSKFSVHYGRVGSIPTIAIKNTI